jgi:isopentenyldiphosphate isomerase
MAKITIVDKNDNVVGSEKRAVAVQKGLIHRIVRVIVKNSKGQIYFQKRGNDVPTWPGRWDQSVGGHVDEGEDYEKAARREMKEELGISNAKLIFVEKWYNEWKVGENILKRFDVLYKTIYDGNITLSNESSDGGWYDVGIIKRWMKKNPDDFVPACIDAFKRYLNS